jgi:hypothetical protein
MHPKSPTAARPTALTAFLGVIESRGFDDPTNLSGSDGMSDTKRPRIEFDAVCPNGHVAHQSFGRSQFDRLLASDAVGLYCAECDAHWALPKELAGTLKASVRSGKFD